MGEMTALVLVITLATVALMIFFVRRVRAGQSYGLRRLSVPQRLRQQVGWAVESGGQLHLTLGRAGLQGSNSPTSVAALQMLDFLAHDSCRNAVPPVVTVGDGTLFVVAQDSLWHAYEDSGQDLVGGFDSTQFVAPAGYPMTYAAGVSAILGRENVSNSVALGRFGAEIGLLAEAANRAEIGQILGTDDPTAMAVAVANTEQVLLGEELFAAAAYLEGNAAQLASLRAQDVMRWLVVAAIGIFALLQLAGLF